MLGSHFVISIRYLSRNKTFSIINILGLALGLTAGLLVYEFVSFERSFENFHTKADNLYRVTTEWNIKTTPNDKRATTVSWSGPGIKEAFPEVLDYARFAALDVFTGANSVQYGDVKIEEQKIFLADPGFLRMFSFAILKGDARTALDERSSVVITESIARKYFKDVDPIGKLLYINDHDNISENKTDLYTVTAVVKDPPANSHLSFDFLLSFNLIYRDLHNGSTYWHWDYTYCYLLLHPTADIPELERKISALRVKQFGKDMEYYQDAIDFKLQPIRDIHLNSFLNGELSRNNDGRTLYFIIVVGICILVSSYINYINLSTVKAFERKTEIGIRKVVGSSKSQLGAQILLESMILNSVALIFSLIFYKVSIPVLESIFNIHWPDQDFFSVNFVIPALIIFALGIILSCVYPALIMTSFKPVNVLKGALFATHNSKSLSLRSVLIVMQFIFCIGFCIATYVMFSQLKYMKTYDKGMDTEQVLTVQGYGFQYYNVYERFKTSLNGSSFVVNIGTSSSAPGDEIMELALNRSIAITGSTSQIKKMKLVLVDENFFDVLKIQLVAGKNFIDDPTAKNQVILNTAAAHLLGFRDPRNIIGETVSGLAEKDLPVIGVIKNYNHRSLKNDYEPMVFMHMRGNDYSWNKRYFFIRLHPAKDAETLQQNLATIKKTWTGLNPDKPFQYFFLDSYFDNQYKADSTLTSLYILFSGFVVLIGCLGLLGLVTFTTLQRTKEIGVRKVLGATIEDILFLLSKDFIKMLLLASAIGIPLVVVILKQWLNQYAFRIGLTPGLVVVPLILLFAISLLTVIGRSFKVAVANPADSIRYE
jgi:putative ABC transport system permease protein